MKKVLSKFKNKLFLRIFIIVVLICALPFIVTLARFVTTVLRDYWLESRNFYFNSNRLKRDNPTYQISNWTGIGEFTIEISMNSRKNYLVSSDFDISYDIDFTCPVDVVCSINKTSGIIRANAINDDSFVITLNPTRVFEVGESMTIPVSATSTSPYVQTISAIFQVVVAQTGVSFVINDEPDRPYLLVSVTNARTSFRVIESFLHYQVGDEIDINTFNNLSPENQRRTVSAFIILEFDPRIVVLDTTLSLIRESEIESELIGGISYVNRIKFPMRATSSREVRFYKIDNTMDFTYPFVNPTSIINFSVE